MLKDPSRDLALRVLGEGSFEDRLIGFSLRRRSGGIWGRVYIFPAKI